MPIFRVFIPDTFINVEARSAKEAEAEVTAHINDHPPETKDSFIEYTTWEVPDEESFLDIQES